MRWVLMAVGAAVLAWTGTAVADDKVEARGTKVDYEVHDGHFESNESGLKGDVSFLAFTDRKAFDKVFGVAAVQTRGGKKQNFVPRDAFDTKLVVAVIHRGKQFWRYQVDRVTAADGTLYVQYTGTAREGAGSGMFASPLIVSVPKGNYKTVVFLENGKKAGTAEVGK